MFEGQTKEKKLETAKKLFTESVTLDSKWQNAAREDFMFKDGFQWTANERRILTEELRPVLTFNLAKSSIDLIMGMNEDNKVVFRCSPVDPTDGFLCDVLNDLDYWLSQNNRFEDEEDDALESGVVSGRGYVAIDFVPDPKRFGDIIITEINVPVNEIHFDPSARRKDLSDARYIFWDRWFSITDFRVKYPKVKKNKIEEFINRNRGVSIDTPQQMYDSDSVVFDTSADYSSDTSDYNKPMDTEFFDKRTEMIRVVHMEYWVPYKRTYLFIPDEQVWEEITDKDRKVVEAEFMKAFPDSEFTTETMMDKKVRWMQFTGMEILYDDDSPLPHPGFSICPVFIYGDTSKRTANHYGIIRLLKDPQREVNKRWSQALNLLNQQVQPGTYAETDAFVDVKQAEQSMKDPGSITWVNPGAINGGKIKERTVPRFPDAPMQMEQFSQEIIKKITGINPDLLGQDRGRQEPGVVIRLRQQQGITLLKPIFKSYNNMKRDLFIRRLAVVMSYMPDSQILRILGSGDRYTIDPNQGIITDNQSGLQANIRDVRNLAYNVTSEESSGNMSKRMLELTALMEMQKSGFPVDPIQMIEKMNIPENDKQRWLKYIESQQQAQQQAQEQQGAIQQAFAEKQLSLEEQKMVLDFLTDMAKIKQMAEKDEKKLFTDEANRKANLINTMSNLDQQDRQMRSGLMVELLKMAKEYQQQQAESIASKGEEGNGGTQA